MTRQSIVSNKIKETFMQIKPKMEQKNMTNFLKLTAKYVFQLEINKKTKLYTVIHAALVFIKVVMG